MANATSIVGLYASKRFPSSASPLQGAIKLWGLGESRLVVSFENGSPLSPKNSR